MGLFDNPFDQLNDFVHAYGPATHKGMQDEEEYLSLGQRAYNAAEVESWGNDWAESEVWGRASRAGWK